MCGQGQGGAVPETVTMKRKSPNRTSDAQAVGSAIGRSFELKPSASQGRQA